MFFFRIQIVVILKIGTVQKLSEFLIFQIAKNEPLFKILAHGFSVHRVLVRICVL